MAQPLRNPGRRVQGPLFLCEDWGNLYGAADILTPTRKTIRGAFKQPSGVAQFGTRNLKLGFPSELTPAK